MAKLIKVVMAFFMVPLTLLLLAVHVGRVFN